MTRRRLSLSLRDSPSEIIPIRSVEQLDDIDLNVEASVFRMGSASYMS